MCATSSETQHELNEQKHRNSHMIVVICGPPVPAYDLQLSLPINQSIQTVTDQYWAGEQISPNASQNHIKEFEQTESTNVR